MGNLFEQSLFIFFDIFSMMFKDTFGITDHGMEMRHRNIEQMQEMRRHLLVKTVEIIYNFYVGTLWNCQ